MRKHKANIIRILYFLFFCCTASWLPLLADYCKHSGLSGTQISLILSITPVMMFAVQPFYGMLSDKIGYKKTLTISTAFAAISYFGYIFKNDFEWLIFLTIFMSLFYNAIQPVLDSLSLQVARNDPRFSYGSLRIAGAAGWSFTGIITGQVIDRIDMNAIFYVSAISMFLVFLFTFFLPNGDDSRVEKIKQEQSGFSNLKSVLKNGQLLFLLLCVFLVSTAATTIWNFYSLYMKENGASASLVGYGLSFQGLCELPLFYFSAKIIFRLGLKSTLILTVVATTIRLVLYSVVKDPVAAIPIELLHGFSWSLFWVACVEYVNKLVDEKWMATGQSLLYASYFGIGAIAGNYWTGFLYDSHMKISEIFLLNAGIAGGVAIILAVFMKNYSLTKAATP